VTLACVGVLLVAATVRPPGGEQARECERAEERARYVRAHAGQQDEMDERRESQNG